jgi:hypothetical protein
LLSWFTGGREAVAETARRRRTRTGGQEEVDLPSFLDCTITYKQTKKKRRFPLAYPSYIQGHHPIRDPSCSHASIDQSSSISLISACVIYGFVHPPSKRKHPSKSFICWYLRVRDPLED